MRLRIGITAAHAAEKLGELRQGLHEPRNEVDEPFLDSRWEYQAPISLKINAYLNWAQAAETQFRELFTDTDLADAVFADRYWHIGAHAYGGRHLPRVPSLIPSSFATRAIGRDVSITIFTASSLNSGEKLFFGRGNYFTFSDIHTNGWTVRKLRGASVLLATSRY